MEIIKREIEIENAKGKPDKFYLAKLRTMLDKSNPMTFNDFIDTGRITPKEMIMKQEGMLYRTSVRTILRFKVMVNSTRNLM